MAKATAANAQRSWTLDDLPTINAEVEALGQTVQRVHEIVKTYDDRLTAAEKIAAAIDVGERQLPSEVVAGLNPGQIFATALSAAIQSVMASVPTFVHLTEAQRKAHVRNAIIVAETTLAIVLERMPPKKAKSA